MNVDCVNERYFGESVSYILPIFPVFLYEENEIPNFANESTDVASVSANIFLHNSINLSLPSLNAETLYFFSAAISIGKPFLSKPNGNNTSNPLLLLYLAKKSMKEYVTACPM